MALNGHTWKYVIVWSVLAHSRHCVALDNVLVHLKADYGVVCQSFVAEVNGTLYYTLFVAARLSPEDAGGCRRMPLGRIVKVISRW